MKRILINAKQEEEIRVAIIDGQNLLDLNLEIPSLSQRRGNIYKGTVSRVEPSLNAVFLDYGSERNGFLPFKEIDNAYFKSTNDKQDSSDNSDGKITVGQQLLVQIQRGERGRKGAALTTRISLAGHYFVLMPNNAKTSGVSRRIQGSERSKVLDVLEQVDIREDEGAIVRTSGIGRQKEELNWDLDYLRNLWTNITNTAKNTAAPALIYEESDIVIRTLRDHLNEDISEIVIDDEDIYNRAVKFIKATMKQYVDRVHYYDKDTPLLTHYQLENKIATMYERQVALPSGGSLVLDRTEALLSIDINSGRATKGSDIEDTALQINLEACEEIALQLRLRDIGGLIVIDFIDMRSSQSQSKVENKLNNLLSSDPARTQIGAISRFGLLEMSRQCVRPSLDDVSYITCPRCIGNGTIRNMESSAIAVLRMMENEATKDDTSRVIAHVPFDVASFLLNEKRDMVNHISGLHNAKLDIVPEIRMETPHFQISRYRKDDHEANQKASYEFSTPKRQEPSTNRSERTTAQQKEKPLVDPILPKSQMPKQSIWKGIFNVLFTSSSQESTKSDSSQNNRRSRSGESDRPHGRQQNRSRSATGSNSNRKRTRKPRNSSQSSDDSRTNNRGSRNDSRSNSSRNASPRSSRSDDSVRTTDSSRQNEVNGNVRDSNNSSPRRSQHTAENSSPSTPPRQVQVERNEPVLVKKEPAVQVAPPMPKFDKPNLVQITTEKNKALDSSNGDKTL